MANDDLNALDLWNRTVVEEIRRFQSLRPHPGRVLRCTPMPPEVKAQLDKTLGIWPLPQSTRDGMVDMVAKKMAGLLPIGLHDGVIPEPEAVRAAAAVDAEAFAAASAYAADKDLATDAGRSEVFQTYVKELWTRAKRYIESRPQAAGTSRAGLAAPPPPAAFVPAPSSSQGPSSHWSYLVGVCSAASSSSRGVGQ